MSKARLSPGAHHRSAAARNAWPPACPRVEGGAIAGALIDSLNDTL